MPSKRLYFPASFAAKFGHMTKFWLTGCKETFLEGVSSKTAQKTDSWGNSFSDFLFFLILFFFLEDYDLYVITEASAATLNHEVTLRMEATCYKDGTERQKKAGSPMTMMLPDYLRQSSFKRTF